MLHIFATLRSFAFQSFRVPALFAAFAFFVCLFAAQSAQAQLTLTVTRTDDRNATCVSGDCSLREAVNAANAAATNDTINFAIPAASCPAGVCTITLPSEISIANNGSLTINGTDARSLIIDGGAGTNRIFYSNLATFNLSGVTLTGGGGAGVNFNGSGGAIFVNGGTTTISGVYFNANTGASDGGGISFVNGTNHRVENSTFSGNTASSRGGGIFVDTANLTVVNTTLTGNSAGNAGGGIVAIISGTLTLRGDTITANTASIGGGVARSSGGTLDFGNTIIAGNTASLGPEIVNVGTATSGGYNLVGDSAGDSTNTQSAIIYQSTDILDTPPLLDPLADYGGTTPTRRLQTGSPAIDKGSSFGLTTDQRGLTRPVDNSSITNATGGDGADIGAFEVQSTPVRTLFDFDGDKKADLSVFRPDNGFWYLLNSTSGFTATQFGLATDKLAPADYDGDGKTDVAVYRGGTWYLNRSQLGFTGVAFGTAEDIPQPADYDGDGRAELAVFRPSNGTWYVLNLQTNQFSFVQFGQNGDKPVVADYDGDGRADYAVYRNGSWYILRSSQGFIGIQFGISTDRPVPADYDGDGRADVAVFRPSNGTWYLNRSTAGFAGIQFGITTDVPAPADYDGDGKADLAVFRDGAWYLQRSTAGFTGVAFGSVNDKPVPSAFVP